LRVELLDERAEISGNVESSELGERRQDFAGVAWFARLWISGIVHFVTNVIPDLEPLNVSPLALGVRQSSRP
jgi:hypothetical protein